MIFETSWPLVAPLVLYPLLVECVRRFAASPLVRDPRVRDVLTRWRAAHNIAMSLFSFGVATAVAVLWSRDGVPGACTRPPRAWPTALYLAWYWSKWLEWCDTLFLLLASRRGTVSRLHYQHHAITATLTGLQTWRRDRHTPLYEWGTLLNALVHTWMYAYYAIGVGRWPRASVRALTAAQLVQHLVMVVGIVRSHLSTAACDRDASGNWVGLLSYVYFAIEFGLLFAASGTRRALVPP